MTLNSPSDAVFSSTNLDQPTCSIRGEVKNNTIVSHKSVRMLHCRGEVETCSHDGDLVEEKERHRLRASSESQTHG